MDGMIRSGHLYQWIRKGPAPISAAERRVRGGWRTIGAAWDYATDRIPVSRTNTLSNPRIMRIARV
jgi:hypothetical protein